MDNRTQLKLITYFFWALMATIGLALLTGCFAILTLIQHQKWVSHTNSVLQQIEQTERDFTQADFAGRNRIISGDNAELVQKREKAIESVNSLKWVVGDNQAQLNNLTALEASFKERFKAQDEQYNSVERDGDKVIYSLASVSKSMIYTENIETVFNRLRMNELDLMRLDRLPRLASWQWRITYAALGVIALLLSVAVALFSMHRRLLERLVLVGDKLDDVIHKTDSQKPVNKDLKKFSDFLQGIDTELPDVTERTN